MLCSPVPPPVVKKKYITFHFPNTILTRAPPDYVYTQIIKLGHYGSPVRVIPTQTSKTALSSAPSGSKTGFGLTRSWPLQDIRSRSRLLCTNQPSFHSPRPPALPTLLQYYCMIIGQYKTPLPTSRVYAIHHTILVITISCKCQTRSPRACGAPRCPAA